MILIVEDDALIQDMLARRLKRRGFEVITASDGQAAVSLATQEMPDLILMDLSLPMMDGLSATRALKDAPKTADIPVIAVTAHAMAGDREKAMEAGCDEYDTKPIDFERLLGKIANFVSP